MAKQELFKQAIAEAKSVREAAIANAKLAMEESLTPHLKELLAQRLAEMEEEEVHEEEESMEEGTNEMEGAYEEDVHEEEEAEEEPEEDEAEDDSEESEDEAEDEEEIEDMTVEDLKDLIRDVLSQEMGDMPGEEEDMEDMEAGMEDSAEDMVSADDEEINIDEILAELAEMEEGEEENIEEVTDPELVALATALGVPVMALAGAGIHNAIKKAAEKGNKAAQAINKMLHVVGSAASKGVKEETEEELNEALKTIETLRTDLNEVNLLNAKLLYVNKIFKANNLAESQKASIIAAFDKAETVKEAKLVFESVSTNIAPKKKETVKEHKSFASKSAGVAPKKEVISESSDVVKRMQKLAGIIK